MISFFLLLHIKTLKSFFSLLVITKRWLGNFFLNSYLHGMVRLMAAGGIVE
jgi:hypothetical protein